MHVYDLLKHAYDPLKHVNDPLKHAYDPLKHVNDPLKHAYDLRASKRTNTGLGLDTDTVELTVKTLLSHLITRKCNFPASTLRAAYVRVQPEANRAQVGHNRFVSRIQDPIYSSSKKGGGSLRRCAHPCLYWRRTTRENKRRNI
eukprot:254522-Prorocentrum_minimum.AAC.1